jgi:DNA-directed RNA polymerase subunit H (RpoH/RPB5)
MTPTSSRRSRKKDEKAAAPKRPFVAHHLAPKHEILGEDETQKVLAELSWTVDRLPKILVTDPGLQTDDRYDKMREAGDPLVGRLVRIRRPSQTAGEAIAYRVIVASVGGA